MASLNLSIEEIVALRKFAIQIVNAYEKTPETVIKEAEVIYQYLTQG